MIHYLALSPLPPPGRRLGWNRGRSRVTRTTGHCFHQKKPEGYSVEKEGLNQYRTIVMPIIVQVHNCQLSKTGIQDSYYS